MMNISYKSPPDNILVSFLTVTLSVSIARKLNITGALFMKT